MCEEFVQNFDNNFNTEERRFVEEFYQRVFRKTYEIMLLTQKRRILALNK